MPPADPALPVQERGSRPTRPLPYEPLVDGVSTPGTGHFALTFGSGPRAGAWFLVTAANRGDGPWTYTTAAGGRITDSWNSVHSGGLYDLTVHGPNGFLRTFRGRNTAPGPEVTARHTAATGVELTMTNASGTTCRLTLTDAYGGGRRVSGDSGFLRRFAGHVENGTPGVSDPGIVTG